MQIIAIKPTNNPSILKFEFDEFIVRTDNFEFKNIDETQASPLAKELFSFPFIKSVFIASNFVTLTKTTDTEDWQDVIPTIKTFLKEYLEAGGVVVSDEVRLAFNIQVAKQA